MTSVIYEILSSFIYFLMHSFSRLGSIILYISPLFRFPLYILDIIFSNSILYFSDIKYYSYIDPNALGYIIIFVSWFAIGTLISWVYSKLK